MLCVGHRRPITRTRPFVVVNDRVGGGIRYQGGIAAAVVHVLGKPHTPTLFAGATAFTENTLDITGLRPLLHQSLGLTLDSLSVVSAGSRRAGAGDYPQLYDTLVGTAPYAGQRKTWIVVKVAALANAEAVQGRTSLGTATVAAAQRIAAQLRQQGIRAKVATATDIAAMDRQLACSVPARRRQSWHSARGVDGWSTTYSYRPGALTSEALAQAWSLRADGITQNVTVFADGTAAATVTVGSAQPPTAPPSLLVQTLPGEQIQAAAANLCGPAPVPRGAGRSALPAALHVPVGPSGVLLGKVGAGQRLALPLDDPGDVSRVHIAADDTVAKRIVARLAGAGARVTVHTRNTQRWNSVRIPGIVVGDAARPASGTTVSVVDGTVEVAPPRPNTVITVAGTPQPHRTPHRTSADVLITQTGPAMVRVRAAGSDHTVEVELFRAENRYVSTHPPVLRAAGPEPVG